MNGGLAILSGKSYVSFDINNLVCQMMHMASKIWIIWLRRYWCLKKRPGPSKPAKWSILVFKIVLNKFLKSFVFLAKMEIKSGQRRNNLSAILWVFFDFLDLMAEHLRQNCKPTFQLWDHPTPYFVAIRF